MLCTVTHGAPVPSCFSATSSRASGHFSRCANVLRAVVRLPRVRERLPGQRRPTSYPVTGVDSKRAENFPSATVPHALATVVFQCPRCMRPSAPRTSRGMSSFHAGASFSATSSLFALESAEIMSHHSASDFSVEKPIVVPWKLRRARRICSAAFIRSSWRGSLGWRFRIRYQSMHGGRRPQVGLERDAVEPLRVERLGAARQRFERRDLADREVGGRHARRSARRAPRRTRRAPAPSARARGRESRSPASAAIDSR